ncbi:MAG: hypothetical protein WKF61_00280 [Luteimonas sp.]
MKDLCSLRVGYVPYSQGLGAPGDRRRFMYYARNRNLRFEIARPSQQYDVVVVAENADLSVWSQYDKGGAKVVYDFIDSYLAIPRTDPKGRLRGLAKYVSGQSRHLRLDYWKAFESMCERADAVICATPEQAGDIFPFCGNVHQILDFQSTVALASKSDYRAGEVFNLVWEGLPENVSSLKSLRTVLATLQTRRKIALHLVTDLQFKRHMGRFGHTQTADIARGLCDHVYLYAWNEQMCSTIISSCDLAVIPINLADPLAAGKPENKLLLFWRMGMPTITTATPAYARAMASANLPMACRDEDDWLQALEHYMTNEPARRHAGAAGKALAESAYGEQVILQKWDAMFDSLL